ncbi:MAG: hypothetical protein OSB19_17050 [Opitutaceae bacterium]|nr:hypothetical protein [Opitutaceae bacterium]
MSIRGERMLQADTEIVDDGFSSEYQREVTVLVRLRVRCKSNEPWRSSNPSIASRYLAAVSGKVSIVDRK